MNWNDDWSAAARRIGRIGLLLPALVLTAPAAPLHAAAPRPDAIDAGAQREVALAVEDGLEPIDLPRVLLAVKDRVAFRNWSVAQENLDRLAAARPMDPLMADEIRRLRAVIAVDEGRTAAARELFLSSGGLTQWWSSSAQAIDELGDVADRAFQPSSQLAWRPTPGTDPFGWVRLEGLGWPARRQMLYLATTVVTDSSQPVALRLGAAQVARVWLNGKALTTTQYPLRAGADQVSTGGWLESGRNTIVVAVASESGDWWLRLRLTAPDGSPLAGVREVNERPRHQTVEARDAPEIRTLKNEIRRQIDAGRPRARLALAALSVAHRLEPSGSGAARELCQEARKDDPVQARLLESEVTTDNAARRDLLVDAIDAGAPAYPARTDLARLFADRDLFAAATDVLTGYENIPSVGAVSEAFDVERWGPAALDPLATMMAANPRCVSLAQTVADWAAQYGRWEMADQALVILTGLAPGRPEVQRLIGDRAARCGDGGRLRDLLTAHLQADPNQPDVRIRIARMLANDDRIDEALVLIKDGLARCPNHIDLLLESAHLLHRLGRSDEAGTAALAVLAERPQNRPAKRLLSLMGQSTGHEPETMDADDLWQLADQADHLEGASVVLLDRTTIDFLPGRLTEETVQLAWLVRDAESSRSLKAYPIPYVPETDRLQILEARILRRDGTEIRAHRRDTPRLSDPEVNMYYDTRLQVLTFDELQDGDLIDISYILTETAEANETGAYEGGILRLGQPMPVLRTVVELSGPPDELPSWQLVNLDAESRKTTDASGRSVVRWEIDDLPAVAADYPPPPPLVVEPHLVYSNHPDWGQLADWYGRHVDSRVRASRQVEDLARDLAAGADTRLEKIARIYAWVTNEIRYVGLEFGEHRFRPFSSDFVLTHRLGDCKDTAALLVALFNSVDIPARMAMVRTADLGPVSADIAVLEDFNHAIAYLPEDDLWLDGTAAGHDAFPPPGLDQGAWVLVVDGLDSKPRTTPIPGCGRFSYRYALNRTDGKNLDLTIETTDTGDAATLRRGHFGGSRNPMLIQRWVQGQFPGAQVVGTPVTELAPGRPAATMQIQATIERSALIGGGGLRVFPGSFDLDSELTSSQARTTPLLVPVRPDLEWRVELRPAPASSELPEPVATRTPYGELEISIEHLSNGVAIVGRFHLVPGLVPADSVPELRAFLVETRRQLSHPLELP